MCIIKKEITFRTTEDDFNYAVHKYINFCRCMDNYARNLNWCAEGSDISIIFDNTIGHSIDIDYVLKNIDIVKNTFINAGFEEYIKVPFSIPYVELFKKVKEIVNYHFDIRTVKDGKFLNDLKASHYTFDKYIRDSDNGLIEAINHCLGVSNIGNAGPYHKNEYGSINNIMVYNIIGNIDLVIKFCLPIIGDGTDSDRFINTICFEATLVAVEN